MRPLVLLLGLWLGMFAGCADFPSKVVPDGPKIPMQFIGYPAAFGAPLANATVELPRGALAEGERFLAEIEFGVDEEGRVADARIRTSSDARWNELLLDQHRKWIYSVRTSDNPCRATRFRALQWIEIQRRDGILTMPRTAAQVLERFPGAVVSPGGQPAAAGVVPVVQQPARGGGPGDPNTPIVPNIRDIAAGVKYPRNAQLAGVEANVLLTIEFDVEGIVSRVYPANGGVADEWGFTQSAVEAASKMRSSRPFAEPLQICWVVGFRLS